MKTFKKIFKILSLFAAAIILAVFFYYGYFFIRIKQGYYTKFNNQWYTQAELKKLVPPQYYDAPAKNNPAEVYTDFREALKNNNQARALSFFSSQTKGTYQKIFTDYQKKNKSLAGLAEIYLPDITITDQFKNFATFNFKFKQDEKNITSSGKFVKDSEGYWRIEYI
jgi:hypothetical protein